MLVTEQEVNKRYFHFKKIRNRVVLIFLQKN